MRQLLRLFTDMFDHMVGKNDVKTVVREGQLRAVDQVKAIALRDPPTVHHVDRINGAVQLGMRCEIMRNSTCSRTNLKHSDMPAPGTEIKQPLDFQPLMRSEERRVGKGGVSTGRSWWSPYN